MTSDAPAAGDVKHEAPRLSPATVFILAALGLYTLLDGVAAEVIPGQRIAYAAVIGICALVFVIALRWLRVARPVLVLTSVWLACVALWMVPFPAGKYLYLSYAIGDVTSIAAPLLLLLTGSILTDLFRSRLSLFLLAMFLLAAAFFSLLIAKLTGATRFEPPHNALLTLSWLLLLRSRGLYRWIAIGVLTAILLIAFESGSRTTLVLWFMGLVYVLVLQWPAKRIILGLLPMAVIISLASQSVLREAVDIAVRDTRFQENIEGGVDESLMARFFEAEDALRQFRQDAEPINYLLGFGHGATFRSVYAPLRNATDEGVVHNIHFGPVMVLYRYGALGLVIYVVLIGSCIASFFSQRRRLAACTFNELFFTFTLAFYLMDGLLRNVVVDPMFSYVLAGFLFFRFNTKRLVVTYEGEPQSA